MTIRQKIVRDLAMVRSVLVNEGAMPLAECLVRRFGQMALGMSDMGHPRTNLLLFRLADIAFDLSHGTNTGGVIDLPEMEGNGRNYVATPPRAWKLLMRRLPIDPARFAYLDLGCGKGRTLLLASKAGFRRVIGVDVCSDLLKLARENLERVHVSGELICEDVRKLEFPAGPLVIFMYNPFYEDVMREVALRLEDSVRKDPREIFVVYYSAAFPQAWASSGFTPIRSCSAVYPNYVIYSSGFSSVSL